MTPAWKYISPESLAIGGIYSEKGTKKLRDLIVFPLERGAIMNTILRGAVGQQVNTEGISISPFITEKILNTIATNTWNRVYAGFVSFGTLSAGILGIFMLFRAIKLVVDTTIHSYALYTLYGWSIHLLGALWDSVTYLLLHIGQRRQHEEHQNNIDRIDRERVIEQEDRRINIDAENAPMLQQHERPTTTARERLTTTARERLTTTAREGPTNTTREISTTTTSEAIPKNWPIRMMTTLPELVLFWRVGGDHYKY
ncbi:unnamed protein product [Trichogramma brassicae]|uniref:Uncharacterized protein n=1 Tax=Trichogramma brassicae TaxID=86971 RepID=A0A6H5IUZ8_9HYME|nr:unnamed protein product [Trichogramma brassicae]